MSRYQVRIPLRWADLDVFRHVNHARTITLLEEARVELVFHRATERGVGDWSEGLLVSELRVGYQRQIPYHGQPVLVSMWTSCVRASRFEIHYEMRTGPGEDDPLAVTATTTMVPFNLTGGFPRRLTPEERAFLAEWADDDPAGSAGSSRAPGGEA